METWEMIKELTEDNEKKFATAESAEKDYYCSIYKETGTVAWFNAGVRVNPVEFRYLGEVSWFECLEPVGFMEAIDSGRCIKTDHDFIYTGFISINEMLRVMTTSLTSEEIKEVMQSNCFYLGDID